MSVSPPELNCRSFVVDDVALLGPWLSAAGLGVPDCVPDQLWGRRVIDDPRILCRVGCDPDGRVLAFYRLDLAPDRTAEITLIVDLNCRRKGVGERMLAYAVAEARSLGLRKILAVIQIENRAAHALFLKAGFVDSATRMSGFCHLERIVHGAGCQPPLEILP